MRTQPVPQAGSGSGLFHSNPRGEGAGVAPGPRSLLNYDYGAVKVFGPSVRMS